MKRQIAIHLSCSIGLIFACTDKTYITNPPPDLPDLNPPRVEWADGGAGLRMLLAGEVELALTAADESGIDSLKIYLDGFPRFASTSSSAAFLWNTASDSDGVHLLLARAWDKAGNMGETSSLLVRVKNNPDPPPDDRTPPRIRWITPAPGSIVRDTTVLEFSVEDESEIDSVKVFVDGVVDAILAGQADNSYILERNTWRWTNGRRLIEIWAWDSAKNGGRSEPIGLTVDNHKVIWVPDDYGTITAAINASVDGDTIVVRAGTYREQLQFFDKNVSLVSESGPEETILDGTGYYTAAWITGGQDTTM
ncbi:MAG: hypothetical protein FJY67_05980, partial [Calditrichaeota bacterium]|nr:hypothetical protein [Calditrichota bacterium]